MQINASAHADHKIDLQTLEQPPLVVINLGVPFSAKVEHA